MKLDKTKQYSLIGMTWFDVRELCTSLNIVEHRIVWSSYKLGLNDNIIFENGNWNFHYDYRNDFSPIILKPRKIEDLKGRIITDVNVIIDGHDDTILITDNIGCVYRLRNGSSCVRTKVISNISDINRIKGLELTIVECNVESCIDEEDEHTTITTHKIHTINGMYEIKWLCESNGYHDEIIYFDEISNEHKKQYLIEKP